MRRLDLILVDQGKVSSRSRAQRLISEGRVKVRQSGGWETPGKAGQKYPDWVEIDICQDEADQFVSRGGMKLAGALAVSGISLTGATVIDVGQSTGGFTDCALQAGASRVIGVEVGHGQLVESLRQDPRVVCLEGMNARALPAALLNHTDQQQGFDLAVMDVSFISQTRILPSLVPLLKPGGQLLSLVKPQFEVGPGGLGKGGIVRDSRLYPEVEQSIKACCIELGLQVRGYFDSPITGGDGNREFFIWAQRH
ncbi:TlyA family RNA methyltransferase [Endozoicomonas sp. GU-1]|uniref:TlyA family RNA methyltransferase n=1 Tax=Endozoicomonas sp. GU-1 TaxID=3009078 RepID=UPI0022B345EB|nr:TlyA family RNA methyltransferase [Endozoicomonas sp. GU-1]WBA82201.1 TlyA family RNA methyltransferase [Endozoicomonas sp. GU-1]WBA85141.1 TlyA family RNA methyltransferase [Endozoicomonas sp. GU-1]